jgi:hypothetical protein
MEIIESLRKQYEDNEYMTHRLEMHLKNLPFFMKTIEDEHTKKTARKHEFEVQKEIFTRDFLQANMIFFIPSTEQYIEKSREGLKFIQEDAISLRIGTMTPSTLMVWKHKLISSILKKIKERLIYQYVPEPYAIKKIISTMPMQKEYARYFLTIIGDILLSKKDGLVYFIDISYKYFLNALNRKIYLSVNKSFIDVFKHKYHDHKYELCRILHGACPSEYELPPILETITTSIALSKHYGSAEQYVQQIDLQDALLLKKHTPESLIHQFVSTHMVLDPDASTPYKDVLFLWKMFLKKCHLPYVISQQNFKQYLHQLNFCENDVCLCRPIVQLNLLRLKQFWEKYISMDDDVYDLAELVELYNKQEKLTVTVDSFRELIELEYNSIVIENNKIVGIKCSLWDKTVDIDNALEMIPDKTNVDAMYDFYCAYTKNINSKHVTKEYFIDHLAFINAAFPPMNLSTL